MLLLEPNCDPVVPVVPLLGGLLEIGVLQRDIRSCEEA